VRRVYRGQQDQLVQQVRLDLRGQLVGRELLEVAEWVQQELPDQRVCMDQPDRQDLQVLRVLQVQQG
jgi:hypothetical protein